MSAAGPAGVGVVGAGNISTQYLTNLTAARDLRVLWIADRDLDKAQFQAQAFGVPRVGALEEVLADAEVEIIVNLTPPAAHVPVALQAIAAGKHVWSEKPIAPSREDARRVLDAAASAGVRFAAAPDTFLGPAFQTARRLVDSGAIGAPQTALALLQQPGPESWHPNPAFIFAKGAGPLLDMGPYYVTALVQLFGAVRRVFATASRARAERMVGSGPLAGTTFPVEVPTHVGFVLEFGSGVIAQGVTSYESEIRRELLEVTGATGALELVDPNRFAGDLVLHTHAGAEPVAAPGEPWARGTGVVELARAIRAGVPERASGASAYHVLDVLLSILDSAERGEPVEVASPFTRAPALPDAWDPTAATL